MNKKLVVAAVLVCGVAGFLLANTVKAQDATDNSAMNADNSTNADNATTNAS